MSEHSDPEMIDEENSAWTEGDFERAKRFDQLPAGLQAKLRGLHEPQGDSAKEG